MTTRAWSAVTDLLLFAPTDPKERLAWMRDLLEEYVERCEELSESNEELRNEKDEIERDLDDLKAEIDGVRRALETEEQQSAAQEERIATLEREALPAVPRLDTVLSLYSNSGPVKDDSNVVRVTFGHNAKKAYELYAQAVKIDDADPAEGARLYRRAITLDPSLAIAVTNLGNILYREGAEDEAISLYTKALTIDAEQPEASYNLGYVRLSQGRYEEAIPLLRRAVECDDRFEDAHFSLAHAYQMTGKTSLGVPHMRRYLELATNAEQIANAKRFIENASKDMRRVK
jgi:tetratricopeptide (TPR) repeat protein